MGSIDDAPLVFVEDRETWHRWLAENHATSTGAWLVTWRRGHGPALPYEDAIEEALCYGWIDSRGGKLDERRSRLYFAPRKPRGTWAASNKARVQRLIADGRMQPAGLAAIERAKANGSWSTLDDIDREVVPDDLVAALAAHPPAAETFAAFPSSSRRMILFWIAQAKRPATRAARILETAVRAQRNERANEPPPERASDRAPAPKGLRRP